MKTHFEKINNRYRGPFEKSKLFVFFNSVFANMTVINKNIDNTKNKIKEKTKIEDSISKKINYIDTLARDILKEIETE